MKKRELTFLPGIFILTVSLISTISAGYACADGTALDEDIGDLKLGQNKYVNGISLGLSNADEADATGRLDITLIVDAQKVIFIENTSLNTELPDGKDFTISIINGTGNKFLIQVDDDSEEMEFHDTADINGFKVYLHKITGIFPDVDAEILVGKSEVILSSVSHPKELITFNDIDYLLEIYSASDDSALVKVSICLNESIKIVGSEDVIIPTTPIQNTTETNTNNEDNNNSDTTSNGSATDNMLNETTGTQDIDAEEKSGYQEMIKTISFAGIALFVIMGAILAIRYWSNKRKAEKASLSLIESAKNS